MKLLATGAAILVVLAVSSQARAAEFLKAEVNPVDIRTGGDLTGCGLEYSGVFRDHTYRSGALSGVSGTINIMRLGKANLGLFFKIGLVDWLDPELKQAKIAKIEKAYVRSGGQAAPETVIPCDNPNSFCGGSGPDAAFKFFENAVKDKIQIGFNRIPKGMDVLLTLPPIDDLKFSECTVELLNKVLAEADASKR